MLLIPLISPSQYTTSEDCKYICIPCNCLAIWIDSPRLNMGTKSASSIAVHEVLTEDKTEENNPEVPDSQSLINSGIRISFFLSHAQTSNVN